MFLFTLRKLAGQKEEGVQDPSARGRDLVLSLAFSRSLLAWLVRASWICGTVIAPHRRAPYLWLALAAALTLPLSFAFTPSLSSLSDNNLDASYSATVDVGTPAQAFDLILDTGSSDLCVSAPSLVADVTRCAARVIAILTDPLFHLLSVADGSLATHARRAGVRE